MTLHRLRLRRGRPQGRPLAGRQHAKTPRTTCNIVELQGTVGSAPAIDRKKGFEEVIAANPQLQDHPLADRRLHPRQGQGSDGSLPQGRTRKKINVLYAHNDDMAIGAIQAIEEAGLKPGKDITIVSIDGVKGAFEAMIAGKLNVTVECNPLLGPQLMTSVVEVVAGQAGAEAHRHRGAGLPGGSGESGTSRRASTDRDLMNDAAIVLRSARNLQRLSRRAGARGRRPRAACRRSPRADGAERRRQVDADQGADRRERARRRQHAAGRRGCRATLAAGSAAPGHQHGLPGSEPVPQPLGGREHLRRPLSAPRWSQRRRHRLARR